MQNNELRKQSPHLKSGSNLGSHLLVQTSLENDCPVRAVQATFLFPVFLLDAFGYFTVHECQRVKKKTETIQIYYYFCSAAHGYN